MVSMRHLINLLEGFDDGVWPRVHHIEGGRLYHGTSIPNAATINALYGQWDDVGDDYEGVSTTTDLARAHGYTLGKTDELHQDFGNGCYGMAPGITRDILPTNGAVLVLDAAALLDTHKIHRVQWQPSEAPEERVIGHIQPLQPYLTGILADRKDVAHWLDIYRRTAALPDAMHFDGVGDDVRQHVESIAALLHHPLLRVSG